jgi:hypothetical protein
VARSRRRAPLLKSVAASERLSAGHPVVMQTMAPPCARLGAQYLRQERGEVIFSEGHFWYYTESHWCRIDDYELRLAVHRYDSVTVSGGSSRVKLGRPRVDSILYEMRAILAKPNFFAEAPVGINCASGFIAFAQDGAPILSPHAPEHRCRHVLKGGWYGNGTLDLGELFDGFESLGLLLPRLLRGYFSAILMQNRSACSWPR